MEPYIRRHCPLITSRIEFSAAASTLPSITPRIEFTADRLSYATGEQRAPNGGPGVDLVGSGEGDTNSYDGSGSGSGSESGQVSLRNRKNKIQKPTGEPGRPGSGGYCLETILVRNHKWSKEMLGEITVSQRQNR
jgi:hypothetical protein